jgi:hypothetical protein
MLENIKSIKNTVETEVESQTEVKLNTATTCTVTKQAWLATFGTFSVINTCYKTIYNYH